MNIRMPGAAALYSAAVIVLATQFLTKLKLEHICFNITQIIMVENEAISNIFASFQEYIDTEQDIREVCMYPYYRPVTTCREKRTPRNKLNL